MNRSRLVLFSVLLGAFLLVTTGAVSGPEPKTAAPVAASPVSSSSANYQIDWRSTNGGGAINASSPNYDMGLSVGQSVTGATQSAADTLGIGFWYGDCYCMCHGDPNCNRVLNVRDVVLAVDVAFRGRASITDPTLSCPRERTDLNCDGVTSIHDVVGLIDVAFRGFPPIERICRPCPFGSPLPPGWPI